MTTRRLAIVSGGSRGLGHALCVQLQALGMHVVELSRSAPHPFSIRADLAQPASCTHALDAALHNVDVQALEEFVFVGNSAIVAPISAVSRLDRDALTANLSVNFVSAVALLASVAARLQDAPGRKVLAQITSGAAINAHAGLSLYSAAKAGMEQFICALALEQANEPRPFIPISIDPGAIDTEMQAQLRAASPADYPRAPDFVQRHREGRLASVDEVAAAVIRILRTPSLKSGTRIHVRDNHV